jgi:hypothetical protein
MSKSIFVDTRRINALAPQATNTRFFNLLYLNVTRARLGVPARADSH